MTKKRRREQVLHMPRGLHIPIHLPLRSARIWCIGSLRCRCECRGIGTLSIVFRWSDYLFAFFEDFEFKALASHFNASSTPSPFNALVGAMCQGLSVSWRTQSASAISSTD